MKKFAALALLLAFGVMFVGCEKPANEAAPEAAPETAPAEPAPTDAAPAE